jgi:hypothetical protein
MAIAIIFAFILGPHGCEKRFVDQVQFYHGNVIDSTTGLAIDSAWIDNIDGLPPYYTFTDSSGNYRAQAMGYNKVDIYCGKPGYLRSHKILYFGDGNIQLDFKLAHKYDTGVI